MITIIVTINISNSSKSVQPIKQNNKNIKTKQKSATTDDEFQMGIA